jgi:membrane dipeptidase
LVPGSSSTDTVADLLREHPPIDLHSDTLSLMRAGYDFLRRHRPLLPRAALGMHVDLPRLQDGGYSGVLLGLVTSPLGLGDRAGVVDRQIDLADEAARRSGGRLVPALAPGAMRAAGDRGAVAYAFGLEGAHALHGRLEPLDRWARRGLRYLTLVHFSRNEAGTPRVGWGASPDGGLTAFGRALVEACESLGIAVDLAHASRRTFADALAVARRPVIVSHAGVAAVYPMWRNLDEDQVRAVARSGGVVGVIFGTMFLGGTTAEAVAEHLAALWRIGGEDLPALGSDWDGLIVPPRDLRDPGRIGNLVAALLDRGVPCAAIGKILRENALRVLDG